MSTTTETKPAEITVTREIAASPDRLYAELIDLRQWEEWSIWSRKEDPDCEWTYEGEPGKGMRLDYHGPKIGKGYITIQEADPSTGVEFAHFNPGQEPIQNRVQWKAAGDGKLEVTWWAAGKSQSDSISRWAATLFFPQILENINQRNLTRLEKAAQAKAEEPTPNDAKK